MKDLNKVVEEAPESVIDCIKFFTDHNFCVFPIYPPSHPCYSGAKFQTPQGRKLVGKQPTIKQWHLTAYKPYERLNTSSFSYVEAGTMYPMNYGLIIPPQIAIIDIDPRNGGGESYIKLQKEYTELPELGALEGYPCVVKTGGGGYHIFFYKKSEQTFRKSLTGYDGIDFLSSNIGAEDDDDLDDDEAESNGRGVYIIGAGSTHVSGGVYRFVSTQPRMGRALPHLPQGLVARLVTSAVKSETKVTLATIEEVPSQDEHTLRRAIEYLELEAPASIEGQNGDNTLYKVCCHLHDMGLTPENALELLKVAYNKRCQPNWSDGELSAKVNHAYTYAKGNFAASHPEVVFATPPDDESLSDQQQYIETAKQRKSRAEKLTYDITKMTEDTLHKYSSVDEVSNSGAVQRIEELTETAKEVRSESTAGMLSEKMKWKEGVAAPSLAEVFDMENFDGSWLTLLKKFKDGDNWYPQPNSFTNACLFIENLPELQGVVRRNKFENALVMAKPAPWLYKTDNASHRNFNRLNGKQWLEMDTLNLKYYLENYDFDRVFPNMKGYKMSMETLNAAMETVASRHPFHPAIDILNKWAPEWDGQARLSHWLPTYCEAEDNAYTREVSRLTIMAIIFRVFHPGFKYDHMLILEGTQGARKSALCKLLAIHQDWFGDNGLTVGDSQKVIEATAGKLVIEMPELVSMSKADFNTMKHFVTTTHDKARMSYERRSVTVPRQFIVIGTTNESETLTDPTGNRRFLPVTVGQIDTEAFKADLEQIYAEGMVEYIKIRNYCKKEGLNIETYALTIKSEEAKKEAIKQQEERRVIDSRGDILLKYLNMDAQSGEVPPEPDTLSYEKQIVLIKTSAVLSWAFGITEFRQDRKAQMEASRLMAGIGWLKIRYRGMRYWARPPEEIKDIPLELQRIYLGK